MRLAELAKQAGVERFVFSSSCSTYGAAGDDFLTETADVNPVTPYGESKVFVDAMMHLADDVSVRLTYAMQPLMECRHACGWTSF